MYSNMIHDRAEVEGTGHYSVRTTAQNQLVPVSPYLLHETIASVLDDSDNGVRRVAVMSRASVKVWLRWNRPRHGDHIQLAPRGSPRIARRGGLRHWHLWVARGYLWSCSSITGHM